VARGARAIAERLTAWMFLAFLLWLTILLLVLVVVLALLTR
jgi:hypothetical protein